MEEIIKGVDVDVPSYFLCPISHQIMRDPVTLPTGITYDRDCIEKWIFSGAGKVGAAAAACCCPVTKQPVPQDTDLIPNHTLRRLIQAWCAANASHGVERFPTPRAPLDRAQVARLLEEARRPETRLAALRKLRSLAAESERNRRCAVAASAPELLVSVIKGCSDEDEEPSTSGGGDGTCEEALATLHSLKVSPQGYCELIGRNADAVDALAAVLRRRSRYQCRAYATFLLKSLLEAAASPARMLALKEEIFQGLLNVIRDEISDKATKAALCLLAQACPWGRNRVKAAEAGAVPVLVDVLLDGPERRTCEMALVVLDQLCGCAEGRAALLGHAAGLAVVAKKIIRVSPLATERAVRVIASVSKYSATPAVLQEMVQVGVVAKLCLLLQVEEDESKAKERAMGILKLHARTWTKNSPCTPLQLLASFTTARRS